MKNADAKLFRELQQFKSATRLLITGTPLQNNLKELWSLLHFLMPQTFLDWEAFEVWFDFSDLEDEQSAQQFIGDQKNQELVKKIHKVLQPLLLRRIKADVASYLPKKREYVLYAPMTKQQTDLYNVISDRSIDTRAYLEDRVADQLASVTNTPNTPNTPLESVRRSTRQSSGTNSGSASKAAPPTPNNAFSMMMGKKGKKAATPSQTNGKVNSTPTPTPSATKRKAAPTVETPLAKSNKSSRQSTPATSDRGRGRARTGRRSYKMADDSDDTSDDEKFVAMLEAEIAASEEDIDGFPQDEDEAVRESTLELASELLEIIIMGANRANTPHRTANLQEKVRQPHHAVASCL